jgi:hypothetical protein
LLENQDSENYEVIEFDEEIYFEESQDFEYELDEFDEDVIDFDEVED